ncbi:MAG: porin family protein [Bacteroidota bacterium]
MPARSPYLIASLAALLLAMAVASPAAAQRKKVENLPKFDNRKFHFGFTLGINAANFGLDQDLSQLDSLISLEAAGQSGFNLGIVSDLHLGGHFGLRFTPTLLFTQRNLEYTYANPDGTDFTNVKPVESTFVEFPLLLKYRSKRLNNFAAYWLTGFKYSLDLISQENVNNQVANQDDIVIKVKPDNYSLEFGFGFDFFLEYFKFSPELKLAVGLNNLIVQDGSEFARPINSLRSRIFMISFHFEG